MKKLLSWGGFFFLVFSCFTTNKLQAQCLKGNCWSGLGTYLYPSGAKYVGAFREGKIQGKGTLYFSNGNKYVGDWNAFYREGDGEMFYTDGGHYKGQFQKSRFNGKGVFTYANGDVYEGDWKNDLSDGRGAYKFQDGDKYVGDFKKGAFEGKGTMYYKSGARYEGSWKQNKKDGAGLYVNKNGKTTQGTWAAGELLETPSANTTVNIPSKLRNCNTSHCKNGKGEFTYGDGSRFVGGFLNGMPEGKGTCFYINGDKYVGQWKNHAPHGEGIMYYHHGKVLGAKWERGNVVTVMHNKYDMDIGEEYIEKDVNPDVKIWAVIVGVARYEQLPVLKYTDDDAYRFYAFLKSPEGGALPDQQIKVLIDEDASRANILNSMKQVFYQADKNDVVLFYFSGHGYDGAFVPADYDGFNNLLFHDEVKGIFEKSAAKHKMCFADACHSGSAGTSNTLAMRSINNVHPTARFYKAFEQSKGGIALLLSSKGEEYSLEDESLRQGIFTHYLMRGLKGEADTNKNKIVTIDEVFKYVYEKVRSYTAKAQTPILSGTYDKNMPVSAIR